MQLNVKLASGTHRNVTAGSVYIPYDSDDLPPQEEVKKLVTYANTKGLELLLGPDANFHHEVWGNINEWGESLLDFIMSTKLHIFNRRREATFLDSRRHYTMH